MDPPETSTRTTAQKLMQLRQLVREYATTQEARMVLLDLASSLAENAKLKAEAKELRDKVTKSTPAAVSPSPAQAPNPGDMAMNDLLTSDKYKVNDHGNSTDREVAPTTTHHAQAPAFKKRHRDTENTSGSKRNKNN